MTFPLTEFIGRTSVDHMGIKHTVTEVTPSSIVLTSTEGRRNAVNLQTMVAHENISEDDPTIADRLSGDSNSFDLLANGRLTCREHETWGTSDHFKTVDHESSHG